MFPTLGPEQASVASSLGGMMLHDFLGWVMKGSVASLCLSLGKHSLGPLSCCIRSPSTQKLLCWRYYAELEEGVWGAPSVPWSFPGGSDGKESACSVGDWVRSQGQKDSLEMGMATHSSILAQIIPRTEEPGELQFMGPQRVGHD